jgi:nicotinamidase-related amidase
MLAYSLLSAANHAVLLLDYERILLDSLRSHAPGDIARHAVVLARSAQIFHVPVMATVAGGGGRHQGLPLLPTSIVQDPMRRSSINAWCSDQVLSWVQLTGRQKLVLAGLRTEDSVVQTGLSAIEQGYEIYVVTDASGGASPETHFMAIERLLQAGATPITAWSYLTELQHPGVDQAIRHAVSALVEEQGGAEVEAQRWRLQTLLDSRIAG